MRVLVACEFSGIVRDNFAARGWDAWSCDILPTERPGQHLQCDVREVLNDGWDLMIAHPPCTYLTIAANRAMKDTLRYPARMQDREEAAAFFMLFANADCPCICIENPVGVMSTRYRKPDQIIQPYYFGEDASKKTCLWLKGLQPLAGTDYVEPAYYHNGLPRWSNQAPSGAEKTPPRADRWKIRSRTFQGIAEAMAQQWSASLMPELAGVS